MVVSGGTISVALHADPTKVASYVLGSEENQGNLYILRIPMDSVGERIVNSF